MKLPGEAESHFKKVINDAVDSITTCGQEWTTDKEDFLHIMVNLGSAIFTSILATVIASAPISAISDRQIFLGSVCEELITNVMGLPQDVEELRKTGKTIELKKAH